MPVRRWVEVKGESFQRVGAGPPLYGWQSPDCATEPGYCGAMSRENVEVVQRCFEALSKEDWVAIAELTSEDCEVRDYDIPDADVYRGPDGLLDWLAHWDKAWETWSPRGLQYHDVDDRRVLALFRMVAKGRGSGVEINRDDAVVYTLDGGKISRVEYYNDQRQALEAVGLQE
jgi:ketosteroid isomerase-like protein